MPRRSEISVGDRAREAARTVTRLVRNPVLRFLETEIWETERGKPFRLFPHQRTVLELAFGLREDGTLPWDTIVYATVKKSGKTTLNAAVVTAWAYTMDAPNEIYALANDEEQAKSRAYGAAMKIIKRHPELLESVVGQERGLTGSGFELDNGTIVKPLASDAAGAAGGNHGLTSWDELWAYTSEGSMRLWDEMTPVPTRQPSARFITTYAGFENESKLLWELYVQGVGPEEYPKGQGRRHPRAGALPIYVNEAARLFVYWDHEPRMPWQTPEYYAAQRRTLRPSAYLRIQENRWVSSTARFLTGEAWDALVDLAARPVLRARTLRVVIGVDAATKKDSLGLIAVTWDEAAGKVRLVNKAVFRPSPGQPVQLEPTAEKTIRDWAAAYDVITVVFDPYQFIGIAQRLAADGIPVEEYPQTSDRLTAMGQKVWDLVVGRNLVVYPDADLREHALNAVSIETPRGWKLAKDKATRKIDLLIALAMACERLTQDLTLDVGLPLHSFSAEELAGAALDVETAGADGEPLTPAQVEAAQGEAERALEARQRRELWNNPGAWR